MDDKSLGTVFCCDIPYEGKGSCIVCGKPLWQARAKRKAKDKKIRSIVDDIERERALKHKLWLESLRYSVYTSQQDKPNKIVVCKCCKERKRWASFRWVHSVDKKGNLRPEYDIMSEYYRPDLVEVYGPYLDYKDLICGNCAQNQTFNNLPLTVKEQNEKDKKVKREYYRKKTGLLQLPKDLICPRCKQKGHNYPQCWVRLDDGTAICRKCRNKELNAKVGG